MTLGSLFSGSGGFELAGIYVGITPVWASEVEPYPIAVTRSRFPRMKHLGSVTEIDGAEIEPVDVITFGSPCQDLSVAGKRAGIHEGERSNLFFEAIRIIKEMRHATHGEYPKYAVWENVPGAFSSNKGEDFRSVLEKFVSVADGEAVSIPLPEKSKWRSAGEIVGNGFSVAWRVLDAQYWGVPQRRKRIYLVADFTGERAGKILFERDGLSGDFESSQATREGAADDAERSVGGSDRVECLNPWDAQSIRQYAVNGTCPALNASNGGGQNRSGVCYALDSMSSNSMKSSNPHSGFHEESVTKTLQAGGVDPTCNQGGNVIVELVAAFMGGQGSKAKGIGYSEDVAPTIKSVLSGGNTVPDVVYSIHDKATRYQGGGSTRKDDGAGNGMGVQDDGTMYTLDTAARHAVVYEPKSAMEENWAESDVKNALRASASKSSHVVGLNDQGGSSISIESGAMAPTLRAQSHQHEPVVVYDARSNGDGETVPTLTGDHQNRVTDYTSVCVEEQPVVAMDPSFFNSEENGALPLLAKCWKEPPVVAMEGSYKGKGQIAENISPALKASHPSDIAYPSTMTVLNDWGGSAISASDNDLSPTLRAQYTSMNRWLPTAWTAGMQCWMKKRPTTLQAKASGGQSLNCTPSVLTDGKPPRKYIVRRLSPLECCRLQGFPDGWADIDRKDDFTDEELDFWRSARNTHAAINGKQAKEYTKAQMLKWYNGLQTDSSVYKMWGNGIALPCAQYVMEGIVLELTKSERR